MPHLKHSSLWLVSISLATLMGCKPAVTPAVTPETTLPTPVSSTAPAAEVMPADAINNPSEVNYQGFGPAKFGGNEESVRMSWGYPLIVDAPAKGSTCFYLSAEHMPNQKRGIGFMFEDAKFVRFDVDDARQFAPGNIKVGDNAEQVLQAHSGRVESAAHKYVVNAHTLTVTPEDSSAARLIFDIGADGKVLSWRIGVPPQVFYVEGCS